MQFLIAILKLLNRIRAATILLFIFFLFFLSFSDAFFCFVTSAPIATFLFTMTIERKLTSNLKLKNEREIDGKSKDIALSINTFVMISNINFSFDMSYYHYTLSISCVWCQNTEKFTLNTWARTNMTHIQFNPYTRTLKNRRKFDGKLGKNIQLLPYYQQQHTHGKYYKGMENLTQSETQFRLTHKPIFSLFSIKSKRERTRFI